MTPQSDQEAVAEWMKSHGYKLRGLHKDLWFHPEHGAVTPLAAIFFYQAQIKAQIQQLMQVTCHKHGWNTSCPGIANSIKVLEDELHPLTPPKQEGIK